MIETRQLGAIVVGLNRGAVICDHLRQLLTLIRAHHRRWEQEFSVMSAQGAADDYSPEQLLVLICDATHCPNSVRRQALWKQCGATPDEITAAERLTEEQPEPVDRRQAELHLATRFHGFLPNAKLAILDTVAD